jgi:hypothetical protein
LSGTIEMSAEAGDTETAEIPTRQITRVLGFTPLDVALEAFPIGSPDCDAKLGLRCGQSDAIRSAYSSIR